MAQTVQSQAKVAPFKRRPGIGFVQGIGLTVLLAASAKLLSYLPLLSIMGHLVIAIMLGLIWRAIIGVPEYAVRGVSFSSKKLLRLGIILLGMRLNIQSVMEAGPQVLAMSIIHIAFTIAVVYSLAKWLKISDELGILTACGTAICGAAAVVAIAPQVKAKNEETAIAAAVVALLGTLFTLIYSFIYPLLGLSAHRYGVLAGATLHEIAHVIAAAAPAGNTAEDIAVVVKLTRVAMLVPVSLLLGIWMNRKERRDNKARARVQPNVEEQPNAAARPNPAGGTMASLFSRWRSIQVPWFILGFVLMSGLNTWGVISEPIAGMIVAAAYLLIAVAMAGLGLGVDLAVFRRLGIRPFWAGLIGSAALSILGYGMLYFIGA
ncbi:YeiH family protein [Paenibacillus fonticola]|uniref:YeiH family protein n=1 Tax=Paenibacillus fonticola TaxID=379896 RepID=UPI0003715FBE|nr:putative sulfate exporter family transporter [Paenibacillus fonticola]